MVAGGRARPWVGRAARDALSTGRVQHLTGELAASALPSDIVGAGFESGLIVPLRRDGQPLGTVLIEAAQAGRQWDTATLAGLAHTAEIVAEPLDNVTRDAVLLAAVGRLLDGVEALSATGVSAAAAAVERAREVGGADAAWLRFPNPDDGSMVVRVDSTLSDEASRHVREAAEAFSPPSDASADAPLYYAEARRSGDVPADIRRMAIGAGLESALIWPLLVRDRLTGDLAFLRRESEGFTPAQITTTGAFARFIGPLLLLPTAPTLGAASEPAEGAIETPGADSPALGDVASRVIEGLLVPAVVEGVDGAVAAVNHAFGRTFNADPAALTGASFQTVVVPAIVRMVQNETDAAQVMRTLRSGPRVRREHAIELRGGRGGPRYLSRLPARGRAVPGDWPHACVRT